MTSFLEFIFVLSNRRYQHGTFDHQSFHYNTLNLVFMTLYVFPCALISLAIVKIFHSRPDFWFVKMDELEPDEPDPQPEVPSLPASPLISPRSPLISPRSPGQEELAMVPMVDPAAAAISKEDEKMLDDVLAEEIQNKTLLDSAEAKVGTKSCARKLKRQSTEKVVDKSLKDNFRGWSSIDIDGTVVEGLSLRETILRDKRKSKGQSDVPMGQTYYANLRN